MSENRKNIPERELNDEALDKVAGGYGFHFRPKSYDREENKATVWKYNCESCGAWLYESELDDNHWICRFCEKPVDRNTAKRSK